MLVSRSGKSLLLTTFLLQGLAIFHLIGGGDVRLSPLYFAFCTLTFIIFLIRPLKTLEGPELAVTILLFQSVGHFAMSNSAQSTDARMIVAHLTSGFITYFLITASDWVLATYEYVANLFLRNLGIKRLEFQGISIFLGITKRFTCIPSNTYDVGLARAPPATAA
jgi:hypothetical protein